MLLKCGITVNDKWKPTKEEFKTTLSKHYPFKYMDNTKRNKALDGEWRSFPKPKKEVSE